jgi:hypothetical protein
MFCEGNSNRSSGKNKKNGVPEPFCSVFCALSFNKVVYNSELGNQIQLNAKMEPSSEARRQRGKPLG